MQNLSDNELDKRFKDAADGYRPPFDPEAWQAMEQQLDRDAGDPGTGFRSTIGRYLPFVLIFLTGSVTGILTWNQFSGNDTNTLSHLSTQTKPVQTQTEAGLARRGSDDVKSGLDNNTETDSRLADLAISKNQTGEGNDLSKPESGSVSTKRPHAREKAGEQNLSGEHYNGTRNAGLTPVKPSVRASHQNPAGTSQSDESRAGTKSNPTAEFPSNDLSVATEGDAAFEQDESHVNVIKDSDNEEKRSQDDLSAANDSTTRIVKSDNTTPTNYESDESREDEKRPSTPLNMFSIAVAFSPDYSSVNFSAHTRPGTNAGLLVEYHFSSRISAQSGAILSQKIYSARNLEYNGYTAQTADGDCHIVDIPVNIIYRLPSRGNYSIYLSAGFSSYLMKKEDYTFVIDSYGGPYEYSRSVRNENNEWFKVLNLSAGVSRRLSDRLFLEAEPFVKLPVSGIGDGKLNVNTLGLFVKLRYSFLPIH